MKMKKNKWITLGILALVAILLIIAIIILDNKNVADEKAERLENKSEMLFDVDYYDIKEVAYTDLNGEYLDIVRDEDGKYTFKDDPDTPCDQGYAQTIFLAYDDIGISAVIEDVEDLSEYELDNPVGIVTITFTDGTSEEMVIGNINQVNNKMYVYFTDDPTTVYAVSQGLASGIAYAKADLIDEEESEEAAG